MSYNGKQVHMSEHTYNAIKALRGKGLYKKNINQDTIIAWSTIITKKSHG